MLPQQTINESHRKSAMRYLMQLLIPALIFIGVVYLVMRSRRNRSDEGQTDAEVSTERDGDKGMVILILVIGALVAVGVVFGLQGLWETGP